MLISSGGSSMPMPVGLIPVGNAVSAAGNGGARPAVPKPPSSFLGGSAGANAMAALRNSYDPLPWTDFFDSSEMIDGRIPVYIAGT